MNAPHANPDSTPVLLHSIEAEQQLLGACLNCSEAVDVAGALLEPQHFYEPIHGQIFEWLLEMRSRGQRTFPTLLIAQLGRFGYANIGGLPLSAYVARLCAEATTIVNTPDFAKVVRDLWERRQIKAVLESGLDLVRAAPIDIPPAQISIETVEQLDAIAVRQIPQTVRPLTLGEACREALGNLSDAMQRGGRLTGITWGLADLDRRTSGIHRGELSILADRRARAPNAIASASPPLALSSLSP